MSEADIQTKLAYLAAPGFWVGKMINYARDPRWNPGRRIKRAVDLCTEASERARSSFESRDKYFSGVKGSEYGGGREKREEVRTRAAALVAADQFMTGRAKVRPRGK